MITVFAAVLLASSAAAASPAAKPAVAASVQASTGTAGAPPLVGLSTYTVSTLYTGDRVRDPFLPPSMGIVMRVRDKSAPVVWDIHTLQLRGILQDAKSDFAIFGADDGTALVLRGGRLYDDRNKPVPGITGHIHIKQRRAELVTADKDVQVFSLGETDDAKDKAEKP
jgi:hypothetical protein